MSDDSDIVWPPVLGKVMALLKRDHPVEYREIVKVKRANMTATDRHPIISCSGRCDGFGELDPNGSYVRIIYNERHSFNGNEHGCKHRISLSEGAAETLIAELQGALAQRPASVSVGGDGYVPLESDGGGAGSEAP